MGGGEDEGGYGEVNRGAGMRMRMRTGKGMEYWVERWHRGEGDEWFGDGWKKKRRRPSRTEDCCRNRHHHSPEGGSVIEM